MAESYLRGIRVEKKRGAWFFSTERARWSFTCLPDRTFYRNGVDMSDEINRCKLLCADDAVLYALGYDAAGRDADLGKGGAA